MAEPQDFVTDSQELKIIVKALTDTLIEYINPHPVIDSSPLLSEHLKKVMPSFCDGDDSEITQSLVHCLLEDESDGAELILELRKVLHKLVDEYQKSFTKCKSGKDHTPEKIANTIMHMIDGSLLKQMSKDQACEICRKLCEKKFIMERKCEAAVKEENGYKICLEMLKHLRERKPEWPFELMEIRRTSLKEQKEDHPHKQESTSTDTVDLKESQSDLETQAMMNTLEQESKFSSKFSDIESSKAIFDDLKKKEEDHMVDFSDEASDSDDEEVHTTAPVSLALREYQKELSKDALEGLNTIICAPTGSGKTRVATYILLEHLKKQDKDKQKKKVAFLARTVPLVMQQFKSLKKYLPSKYKMENITGDSEYSNCLHKLLHEYDVFVMTPRILENHVTGEEPLIEGGLAAFSLLIFDECHHTRKGEAYNTLMLSYLHTKQKCSENLPQVVGLTASIGVEKAKSVSESEKSVLKICGNLDAVSISKVKVNEDELKKLVPVPEEEMQQLIEREEDNETIKKILDNIGKLEESAKHYIKEINDEKLESLMRKIPREKKSQQYGQWIVQMEKQAMASKRDPINETKSPVRSISVIAEHLKAYNVAFEIYELAQRRDVVNYLEKRFRHFHDRFDSLTVAEETFYSYFEELKEVLMKKRDPSNPNLKALKRAIKENLFKGHGKDTESDKNSKGIVFVRTRFLAHALASWLEHSKDGQLQTLRASVFTGTEATEDEGGMTSAQQEETIEKFKSGDIRLLVATSVAEEGIDIPDCNLVIKYNHVGNEVNTVQMRGRSRKKGGKSVLLAFDKMYKKELINQHDAKMMEEAIKNVSNMKPSKICEKNEENQKEILQNEELYKFMKLREKNLLKDKPFKMVCKLCRQVVINSEDIKLIDESHRVVVNREFKNQVKMRPNNALELSDQIALYGKALCRGKPEKKAECGNVLGSMMIFNKIPFVVLSVKSFGFEVDENSELFFCNSWKKVPYRVKDIQMEDLQRFLVDNSESQNQNENLKRDFQADPPIIQSDGRRRSSEKLKETTGTKKEQFSADASEESGTEAKFEASDNTGDSLTGVKAVNAGTAATQKDSGFMSVSARQNEENIGDESVTNQKEAYNNALVPKESDEAESKGSESAKKVNQHQHMSDNNHHLQDAVHDIEWQLMSSKMSTMAPPKVTIDTPDDSWMLGSPEISNSEEDDM